MATSKRAISSQKSVYREQMILNRCICDVIMSNLDTLVSALVK